MSTRIDFLTEAINEAQETNRFLDTKAGVLAAFESALLVAVVSALIDPSSQEIAQQLIVDAPPGYLIALVILLAVFSVALVAHIIVTLRVIFPQESPVAHVDAGDDQPRGLFFLYQMDDQKRIQPSLTEYAAQLSAMSEEDIIKEYTYELLKLAYIRKRKSDGLASAFNFLIFLIVGIILIGVLIAIGTIVYS